MERNDRRERQDVSKPLQEMTQEERLRYERWRAAKRKKRMQKKRRARRLRLLLLSAMAVLTVCFFLLVGKVVGVIAASIGTPETESQGEDRGKVFGSTDFQPDAMPEKVEIPEWIHEDLIPVNEYSRPGTRLEEVNGVVVHYTGNPGTTAEQNNSYFKNLAETHEANVSSNFLIGMDGKIIMNVPIDEVAYCSNERNWDTISIECCHPDESGKLTKETYDSLIKLVSWLNEVFDLKPEDVIRHYDVTGKICPKYFVDHEDAWQEFLEELSQ